MTINVSTIANKTTIVEQNQTVVVGTNNSSTIVISNAGLQGPKGDAGSTFISVIAGETIGSNRAIYINSSQAFYASNTDLTLVNKVIGVSINAVNTGEISDIQVQGEMDGFSGLTVGSPVYLQANGVISSTLPSSGFIQQLGVALTATKILVNIQPSLILG